MVHDMDRFASACRLLFLAALYGSNMVLCIPAATELDIRQSPIQEVTNADADTPAHGKVVTRHPWIIALGVLVPLAIVVSLIIVPTYLLYQWRASARASAEFGDTAAVHPLPSLWSTLSRFWRSSSARDEGQAHTGYSGELNAESRRRSGRRRTRRRQRNDLRRTDSGHTVHTLPEYRSSLVPGEVALCKTSRILFPSVQASPDVEAMCETRVATESSVEQHAAIDITTRRSSLPPHYYEQNTSERRLSRELLSRQTLSIDPDLPQPTHSGITGRLGTIRSMLRRGVAKDNHLSVGVSRAHLATGSFQNADTISWLSPRSRESMSVPLLHRPRTISEPFSIRRLQASVPLAGYTDQQIAFLTSVESLNKFAMPCWDGQGRTEDSAILGPPAQAIETDFGQAPQLGRRPAPILTTAEEYRQERRTEGWKKAVSDGDADMRIDLTISPST